ncbi:hypothetical protein CTAYLR_001583 [Chrysophaeum taylorii]|uniref:TauD/TfdA-like domain-containing protein n=1 Tax=Chrysophaeum taylorii TaxID=2483200 RepID=A0AAD7XKJ9_9STRA|nr:hypothetical protein CTAYLR_001583 [Chrysophaeum taylorii]
MLLLSWLWIQVVVGGECGGKGPWSFDVNVDPSGVHEALRRDGAAILRVVEEPEEVSDWQELAATLPQRVFGDGLVSKPMVAGVHLEQRALESRLSNNFTYVQASLLPHTDGFIYGDHQPDYVVLLVESQSEEGGESFVVDGEKVLSRLAKADKLWRTDFDLTEHSPPGVVEGRRAVGPLVRRAGERLWWRRQVSVRAGEESSKDPRVGARPHAYQSLWTPLVPEDQALLDEVDAAIQDESREVPRFKVPAGRALLLDNYRLLHAREAYGGPTERRVWRVWIWTTQSLGIPDGVPQVASTTEAGNLL